MYSIGFLRNSYHNNVTLYLSLLAKTWTSIPLLLNLLLAQTSQYQFCNDYLIIAHTIPSMFQFIL